MPLSTFYENFTKMMTSLYESCHYHHYYLVPILFHRLKWKSYPHQALRPHPSSAASLVRSNLSSVSVDVPVLTSHTNELLQYVAFCVQLPSLNKMFQGLSMACNMYQYFTPFCGFSVVWLCHILFIHSSVMEFRQMVFYIHAN